MDQLSEIQKQKLKKSSDKRLQDILIKLGFDLEHVLQLSRSQEWNLWLGNGWEEKEYKKVKSYKKV